ncbi:protein scabrous [Parasteatoda tepidariorum]|uniref:protein scabrous n=1 Tax=Parasteatoda tepidariorum TaxID=114398 RepID=UPI00077FD68B|nr:protein scabrous [Parasteatoda tepidariorum]
MWKLSMLVSALIVVGLSCLRGCWGSSRRLRYQLELMRSEQFRDRERIEILEKNLSHVRGERNVPDAVPAWLGDILEELNSEIGEVVTELRKREKVEAMLEGLQARHEQGFEQLRRLDELVKVIQEEQKSISRRAMLCNETALKTEEVVANSIDPWKEEGSGDLEEAFLIPTQTSPSLKKTEDNVKIYLDKAVQEFKSQQNLELQRLEQRMDHNLLSIKEAINKSKSGRNELIEECHKLITNMTDEFHSSITQMKNVSDSLSNVWKEVSQVEFNAAQYQAALDVLERDWAADNKKILDLQTDLEQTKVLLRNQSQQFLSLELMATNMSLQQCHKDGTTTKNQLRLQNLEVRLVQTNMRLDSWSRQADIYRSTVKTTMYNFQDAVSNTSGKVDAMKEELHEFQTYLKRFIHKLPKDCSTVKRSGLILIQAHSAPVEVYCNMNEGGRSWLVIQRRMDGSLNFFKNWTEYKRGFGHPAEEFWIGNEVLHHLTSPSDVVLHIDMWDLFGRYWYAEYDRFHVKSESDLYSLELGEYSGNATDSFSHHSGMGFSTHDRDNDASSAHCAVHHTGGWWYQHCHRADLNGRYPLGMTWYDERSHDWLQLQRVEMKIAPFSVIKKLTRE